MLTVKLSHSTKIYSL